MNILLAPASFKGSLSALGVANVIREAIRAVDPAATCTVLPQADGGEGTIDALSAPTGAAVEFVEGVDLAGTQRDFPVLSLDQHSFLVEAASCIGWVLQAGIQRDPDHLFSDGLAYLLRAVAARSRTLYCALGGTATTDAGYGLARSLGAEMHFRDASPHTVTECLRSVQRIRWGDKPACKLIALVDVDNPLCGPEGAVMTYGPQKGVPENRAVEFDAAVRHFASIVRRDVLNVDPYAAGMGAAGGLGFALAAFCGASLQSGADFVRERSGFNQRIENVDVIVTGEGRFDAQSHRGKVIHGIVRSAAKRGLPVIAFTGSIEGEADAVARKAGLSAVVPVSPPGLRLEEAMNNAERLLYDAVYLNWSRLREVIRTR